VTDLRALLAAMAADPADDTVRLAYADYLEENGQADRAEFVRVQVELARMNVNDPARYPLVVENVDFLRNDVPRWRAELPRLPGIEWGDFSRGLVEEVQAATEGPVIAHAAEIFAEPAVHVLRLARLADPRGLADVPQLERLRVLKLIGGNVGEATLRTLLGSPHLRNLLVLDLHGNRAGDGTAADVADGRFRRLEELWLGSNRVGNAGARALAESKHLPHLRFLDLRGNSINERGLRTDLVRRFGKGVKL
jgi:uncharacterized protein (TIGR02996 family)